MESQATTRAAARTTTAAAQAIRSQFTLCEVSHEEYLEWFEQVGQPYLFSDELREIQQAMWFTEDWAQVTRDSTSINAVSFVYDVF